MEEGQVLHVQLSKHMPLEKRFEKVVEMIVELIEDGRRDQIVRQKAIQIVNAAGVQGHDELGEIRAITKWVQNNLVYRKEPVGIEYFHTARRLLRDVDAGKTAADCDDFVVLGGSLLGSLGYSVGALIVDSSGDGTFNHVMLVTRTFSPTKEFGSNWIPIELIYPDFQIGESVPISKVYPLMAGGPTANSPITRKTISGIGGLGSILNKHPLARALRGNRK